MRWGTVESNIVLFPGYMYMIFLLFLQIKVLQSQVADMKTAGVDRRHLEVPTQDELEDIRREYTIFSSI